MIGTVSYKNPTSVKPARFVVCGKGYELTVPYPYHVPHGQRYEYAARRLCAAIGWEYVDGSLQVQANLKTWTFEAE